MGLRPKTLDTRVPNLGIDDTLALLGLTCGICIRQVVELLVIAACNQVICAFARAVPVDVLQLINRTHLVGVAGRNRAAAERGLRLAGLVTGEVCLVAALVFYQVALACRGATRNAVDAHGVAKERRHGVLVGLRLIA